MIFYDRPTVACCNCSFLPTQFRQPIIPVKIDQPLALQALSHRICPPSFLPFEALTRLKGFYSRISTCDTL
jgi:hypothetical protein